MRQKYKVYINNQLRIIAEDWDNFCSDYIMIPAAGGVVYNERQELLMIFRNGKWDLPKGKIEIGETTEECALREVQEECGLADLTIIDILEDTYHTYELSGKHILKRTHWYKMFAGSHQRLCPQISEGITKVCWVIDTDIDNKLKNSYANIQENLHNG